MESTMKPGLPKHVEELKKHLSSIPTPLVLPHRNMKLRKLFFGEVEIGEFTKQEVEDIISYSTKKLASLKKMANGGIETFKGMNAHRICEIKRKHRRFEKEQNCDHLVDTTPIIEKGSKSLLGWSPVIVRSINGVLDN